MPSAYLSKSRAAKALGISTRRLAELAQSGRIPRHYTNDPKSHRRIAVFRPDDIKRLGQERLAEVPANSSQAIARIAPTPSIYVGANGGGESQGSAYPHSRPWLTISEAADYSGLPQSFLSELIANAMDAKSKAPKLPALDVGVRPGGRWRIARRDLDALEGATVRNGAAYTRK